MQTEPKWLVEARRWIGTRETKGPNTTPQIRRWWVLIRAPFTDDETPWCAGFVGGVLESVGLKSTDSAAARSYLHWGVPLAHPAVGCIAVYERGPTFGHTNFVIGQTEDGRILGVGGNQNDAVTIAAFDPKRLLGLRWPISVPLPSLAPLPVLVAAQTSTREA